MMITPKHWVHLKKVRGRGKSQNSLESLEAKINKLGQAN
jgi:hypothetical protein